MPPPGMPAGISGASSFSLISETSASVVSIRPEIDAALERLRALATRAQEEGLSLFDYVIRTTVGTPGITSIILGVKRPEQRFQALAPGSRTRIEPGFGSSRLPALELDLPDRTIVLRTLGELEFALAGRTQFPVHRIARLIARQ